MNPGSAPGDDVLDDLAQAFNFHGLIMPGFGGTLGEGAWTFMFKEGNTDTLTVDAYASWTLSLEVAEIGDEGANLALYSCADTCNTDVNGDDICDEIQVVADRKWRTPRLPHRIGPRGSLYWVEFRKSADCSAPVGAALISHGFPRHKTSTQPKSIEDCTGMLHQRKSEQRWRNPS